MNDFLSSNQVPVLVALTTLAVLVFYIPFIRFFLRSARKKRARQEFFRAVHSTFARVPSDEEAAAQIGIIYKKMPARFSHIPTTYKNTADFLEDLLYRVNAFGKDKFKQVYDLDFNDEFTARVVSVLNLMKGPRTVCICVE